MGPRIITPDSDPAPILHINQKAAEVIEPAIQAVYQCLKSCNCPDKDLQSIRIEACKVIDR